MTEDRTSAEGLDKRIALLQQEMSLGFVRIADLVSALGTQILAMREDIARIELRLEARITKLEERADAHERKLDRYAPWLEGMQKVVWIVVGLVVVAAVGGIGWAIVQSGGLK